MHIRLIAIGDRQPAWVNGAVESYAKRLPVQWRFRLEQVAVAARPNESDAQKAVEVEGLSVLRRVKAAERVVALDERGKQLSSGELSGTLGDWQQDGRDVALVIGGPDGLSQECLGRAEFRWSLSRLTLPHGLARVIVVEQLYRAWSLTEGHPYHRA
ncbi:MAG TPA: 23S rRNA (pseudouridine(1915)-N(3))-methyltransferase RlmH [Woeseiaceae bacterium]|nr:23S rRNA (pseudouridine(1915)-N(3))-methyltransferase RlmH [Woeseiaceae bacterium]